MTLGQTIRNLRKERKITQKALAQFVGISANALVGIEKDISFPTEKNFRKICEGIGVSVGYMLISTLTEEDVPDYKRKVFRVLVEEIKEFYK